MSRDIQLFQQQQHLRTGGAEFSGKPPLPGGRRALAVDAGVGHTRILRLIAIPKLRLQVARIRVEDLTQGDAVAERKKVRRRQPRRTKNPNAEAAGH